MEVEPSVCFGFLVLLVNTASVARSAIYIHIQLDKWDGRLGIELGGHEGSTIVLVIAESKFSAHSHNHNVTSTRLADVQTSRRRSSKFENWLYPL